MRVSEDLDIPLGAVMLDITRNENYVFLGYFTNTVGFEICMAREIQPGEWVSPASPWIYRCASTETFLKRFPSAEIYRRA